MKKIIVLICMLIPLWLAAQEIPFSVKDRTRFSSSCMVGYETIDSLKYYQMRLIQEFDVWKFGLGLDMDFLIDKDFALKKDDWNHLGDYFDKIYYLKYAKKGEPFYFHLGGFPGLTMGNGLIMQNYSNMQLYPDLRNPGLMIGGNPHWPTDPSFELFTSNIRRNQIMSLAARCKPIPDSTWKYIKDLTVGISVAMDRNQYGNIKYVVSDSLYHALGDPNHDPISIWGIAYTLPVYKNDKITLGQYAEFAHIAQNGSGAILPGIYAEIKNLRVNLEYRIYGSKFVPGYFDRDYEEERGHMALNSDNEQIMVSKEDDLQSVKASHGWNGSINAFLFNKMKATFGWQNVSGKELKTGKSIWFSLWVDTQYKRLENVSLSYSKNNTESMAIERINQHNAEIKQAATIRVYKKRWYMISKLSAKFKDNNGDGKVRWLKEGKFAVGAGVKYAY